MRWRMANGKWRVRIAALIAAGIILSAVQPVRAYVTRRLVADGGATVQQRWAPGAFPIPWTVNSAAGSNISGAASQNDVFSASFAAWQAPGTATISFVKQNPAAASVKPGYDQINLVTSNLQPEEYESSALGLTVVYAFTQGDVIDEFDRPVSFAGQIMEADVMFNPSIPFSTYPVTPSDHIDLQSVATHEIGHFLGLDHSTLLSAVMFPTLTGGTSFGRTLSADDIAGVSSIYPSASFASTGTLAGTVRTTTNALVYGAIVTAVNASGQPVASAITDTEGKYSIAGLQAGTYTVYAEPMDRPVLAGDFATLGTIYPGSSVFTNFTTRFR